MTNIFSLSYDSAESGETEIEKETPEPHMPIYEYQALSPVNACNFCRQGFEIFQRLLAKPLSKCPDCGQPVKKNISWCHSAVVEKSETSARVEKKIAAYERSGMWSHAAELADKQSEKNRDKTLKVRALENYKKAGYNADSLAKHAKLDDK